MIHIFLSQVRIAMVGKYTGLADSYLSVLKVKFVIFYILNEMFFQSAEPLLQNIISFEKYVPWEHQASHHK